MYIPDTPLKCSSSESVGLYVDPTDNRRNTAFNLRTLCGGLIALVILNAAILVSVVRLARETCNRQSLDKLESRLEALQGSAYRWPLPNGMAVPYDCLYAVGGGPVHATGGFPQSRLTDESKPCQPLFDWYFSTPGGQYWADLDTIGTSAIEYLTVNSSFTKGDAKNMVIFDIDETLLSNIDEIRTTGYKIADGGTENQFAPSLQSIKNVYKAVYDYGMSVALITGRSEDDRTYTQDNLAAEGFGNVCDQDEHGTLLRSQSEPCYVALHMRDLDTDRHKLASVYKPERRLQLLDAGYVLVASFGDQYSDLEGSNSAIANYKIPNPMYYIL